MSGVETANIPPDTLSRRGGLIGWGVLLIVVGSLGALGNIDSMLSLLGGYERSLPVQNNYSYAARQSLPFAPEVSWKALATDAVTLAMCGGIVWTGIASCTGRRWVRPVVLILCGFIIAIGLFFFVGMTLAVPTVIDSASTRVGHYNSQTAMPTSMLIIYGIHAALLLGSAVVLPWFVFRYYASPRTRQLLDALNPERSWTDGVPIPVLGWAAVCMLASLGMIFELDLSAIPCFTFALDGLAAWIVKLVSIVVLAWGAWLCYRVDRVGFLLTSTLIFLLHVSTVVFFWRGGTLSDLQPHPAHANVPPHAAAEEPTWFTPTISSLEGATILAFGVYVSFNWPRRREGVAPSYI